MGGRERDIEEVVLVGGRRGELVDVGYMLLSFMYSRISSII